MKFKLKTLIIFCISFLVLIYPVYKLTNAKIYQYNLNEDLETFQINTFIKLKSLSVKLNKINKHLQNINQNFFDGRKVIQLKQSNSSLIIIGQNYRNNLTSTNELSELQNRIFYLPLVTQTLFSPFSDLKKKFEYNNLMECRKIKYIETNLVQIDNTDYILSSKVTQTRTNDTEVEKIFMQCLPESVNENIDIYANELDILNKIKKQDNLDLLENFISFNDNLFLNEDMKKKFTDEINKIEKIFFGNSSNKILEYYFNKPFNYKIKMIYKKDFSTLNVSIIMTLLLNTLIFYILYFLRIRLKFLKIIF